MRRASGTMGVEPWPTLRPHIRHRRDEVRRLVRRRRREGASSVARRLVEAKERGLRVVGTVSAMGKTTDGLIALANDVSPGAEPARDGHAAVHRRAHLVRAGGDGDPRPRPRGRLADRLAGRHRDRRVAHEGEDPADQPAPRAWPRSTTARSCWSPASRASRPTTKDVTTLGRGGTDATAVALAAALGAACEIYSDVPGVFTDRPADRAGGAQARARLVRGDARDVRIRREGADAAVGRARPQPRSAHPRPLDVLGRAGHLDRRGRHGERDHLGGHAQREGGRVHADGHPRPPGRRGHRVRRGRRAST